MENEKLFQFMEKMYSEMQNGFSGLHIRMDKLEEIVISLEQSQLRLENEFKDTKKTLYDGYIQNTEAINRLEAKVDFIAEKVSKNELDTKVLQYTIEKKHRG
jgi:exonuclease VII small subunit